MSASIRRVNTCGNCVFANQLPGELLCQFNPPVGHPIVAIAMDDGGNPVPRILGTVAVWPKVSPDLWCGHHKVQLIQHAHEVPKQLQTFGGVS